jgi:ribosomal protein S18 acetylase RimI-like enzyme
LYITKVSSESLLLACRRLLAKDPVFNVLPLGDLYSPLLKVSSIYSAVETNRVIGVASVYRAFSTPSLVLSTAPTSIKQALITESLKEIPSNFISLCSPDEISLFKNYAAILRSHPEQQMIANPPKPIEHSNAKVSKVSKDEFELLNRFYLEHHSEAWTPIQFKTGPYYYIKQDIKIVSAAGVHIVTPQIAHLGNIITDEAYRNRGYSTACTSTLATDLASKGRIISLFVRVENAPAIHMYEKLGFHKTRDIAFLIMRKNASQQL